jgi:tRNA pseudouridine55 synthase
LPAGWAYSDNLQPDLTPASKDHLTQTSFAEGSLLLIDKPLEWTSFDAVKKVRYAIKRFTGLKKIKVGHAGTLDPLATGLLIICTGKFTKKLNEFADLPKTYTGTITIGAETVSHDLEAPVINEVSTDHIDHSAVVKAVQSLTGIQMQIPPMHSAKWVDGKRAYEAARKGEEVKLKPNQVEIFEFEVDTSHLPEIKFKVVCSKGTYIRSLARDLGEALGVGGYLSELRRTHIGDYAAEEAISPIAFQGNLFPDEPQK